MELNTRYVRTAPGGDESIITINNLSDVKYHQDLEKQGFIYKKVVIHQMRESCPSCEA